MGREVKRVPLNFTHTINEVWTGYINNLCDASRGCPFCDGTGSSPQAAALKDKWYGNGDEPFRPEDRGSVPFTTDTPEVRAFAERNVNRSPEYYGRDQDAVTREAKRLADLFNNQWSHHLNADDVKALIDAGRLMDFTHTCNPGEGWVKRDPFVMPTPQEVNAWSIGGFGHDAINQWICVKAECDRLGVSTRCSYCDGEGKLWLTPEAKQAAEDWERTEPPEGDGWQMWETVSEGSPISPVFATAEELAHWLADTGASSCGRQTATYDQWLAMIQGPGWAASAVMDEHGFRSGVEAAL